MVAHDVTPPLYIHACDDGLSHGGFALEYRAGVEYQAGGALRVAHGDLERAGSIARGGRQLAGIADLPARLRVERGAVQHDGDLVARARDLYRLAPNK